MPKLRVQTLDLKKVPTRISSPFIEQINAAMAKLGMQSRAGFVRIVLIEKVRHILKQASTREVP